jgi:hypothetical protein
VTEQIDWQTLQNLCASAGLGREFKAYEETLPNVITTAIVVGTDTVQKYHTDPDFHAKVHTLVGMIVAGLTARPPGSHTPLDMEELSKVFLEEFKATRE